MRGSSRWFALLLATWAPDAWARCGSPVLFVDPPSDAVLPTNPIFVVSGPRASSLRTRRPRLISERGTVALRIVSVSERRAPANEDEVVLAPEEALAPHARYTLVVSERFGLPPLWGSNVWTTGDGPDRRPPTWIAAPTAGRREYVALGCGPEQFALVDTLVDDDGPGFWIRTRIRPADGGASATRMLWVDRCEVAVGHGMCGGPFRLDEGRAYVATLEAVDLAGHEAPAAGDVEIVGPRPADRDLPWHPPAWVAPGRGLEGSMGCTLRPIEPEVSPSTTAPRAPPDAHVAPRTPRWLAAWFIASFFASLLATRLAPSRRSWTR